MLRSAGRGAAGIGLDRHGAAPGGQSGARHGSFRHRPGGAFCRSSRGAGARARHHRLLPFPSRRRGAAIHAGRTGRGRRRFCLADRRRWGFDRLCVAGRRLCPACRHYRPAAISRTARMLPSSSGQDAALSRLKHEFDSRWERQFFLTSEASLEKLSASSSPKGEGGAIPHRSRQARCARCLREGGGPPPGRSRARQGKGGAIPHRSRQARFALRAPPPRGRQDCPQFVVAGHGTIYSRK